VQYDGMEGTVIQRATGWELEDDSDSATISDDREIIDLDGDGEGDEFKARYDETESEKEKRKNARSSRRLSTLMQQAA